MRFWPATMMVVPAMVGAAPESSDAATFVDVENELVDWALAMSEHAGGKMFEDIAPYMARSFWYEGLVYEPPFTISTEPEPTAKLARRCKKKYGARGVARGTSEPFLACLAISSFENALGDNPDEWSEAAPARLPPPFRKYRAKLAKLAKNHWLLISHFKDTDEHVEHWNLFLVERGGDRLIAGVIVGRVRTSRRGRA